MRLMSMLYALLGAPSVSDILAEKRQHWRDKVHNNTNEITKSVAAAHFAERASNTHGDQMEEALRVQETHSGVKRLELDFLRQHRGKV